MKTNLPALICLLANLNEFCAPVVAGEMRTTARKPGSRACHPPM